MLPCLQPACYISGYPCSGGQEFFVSDLQEKLPQMSDVGFATHVRLVD